MWLNMLAVNYYFIFPVYMVDGSVAVTFIPKQVNTFVLLGMNCKIDNLGVLKSLILYINDVMERYYIYKIH